MQYIIRWRWYRTLISHAFFIFFYPASFFRYFIGFPPFFTLAIYALWFSVCPFLRQCSTFRNDNRKVYHFDHLKTYHPDQVIWVRLTMPKVWIKVDCRCQLQGWRCVLDTCNQEQIYLGDESSILFKSYEPFLESLILLFLLFITSKTISKSDTLPVKLVDMTVMR